MKGEFCISSGLDYSKRLLGYTSGALQHFVAFRYRHRVDNNETNLQTPFTPWSQVRATQIGRNQRHYDGGTWEDPKERKPPKSNGVLIDCMIIKNWYVNKEQRWWGTDELNLGNVFLGNLVLPQHWKKSGLRISLWDQKGSLAWDCDDYTRPVVCIVIERVFEEHWSLRSLSPFIWLHEFI